MKKLIMIIILLFLVGCKSEHEHNFETKVVEANCINSGYTIYSCGCGYSYQDDFVDALDHNYGEWNIIKEATCVDSGRKEKYCSRCYGVVATPISKPDCEFRYQVVNKPTYYEEGLLANVCSHGLIEDSVILPSYSSGKYLSTVINIPSDNVQGLRKHRITVNGIEYVFYEEFEGIKDDTFVYEYKGIDVILTDNGSFTGGDLVIPEGVTVIGYVAFRWNNITSLSLPSSLREIRSEAFRGCNIKSLDIPKNVVSIADSAFKDNTLESIAVDSENSVYYSVDNTIIIRENNTLVLGTNKIPNGVKCIGRYAFSNSDMSEIIIPEGVISIYDNAFRDCQNLKYVYIPSTIEHLGTSLTNVNVFAMCPNLESIEVSKDNKRFKSINNSIVEISTNTLITASLNTSLDDIRIIGYNAFEGLNITSIVIPDNVVEILPEVFINCQMLEEVKLPSNIKVINNHVFYNCVNLDIINLDNIEEINTYAFYGCKLTDLRLDSVMYIFDYAFNGANIKSLYLPKSLVKVSSKAFYNCNNINSIIIDPLNEHYEIYNNSLINSETKEVIVSVK